MLRLLYLNYGAQSGVVPSLTAQLRAAGVSVLHADVLDGFLYQRRLGPLLVPNARPEVFRAVFEAMRHHRRDWKSYYLQTTYAFEKMTERAHRAVVESRPDVVLQSGVLFGPGHDRRVPTYLFLDNTRAIAERYPVVEGMPPPLEPIERYGELEREVYLNARGIFVMSNFVKQSLVGDYGVDGRRVHVVGAGPNVTPGDQPLPDVRELAFLFVGLSFPGKGGNTLLDAFRMLKQERPESTLWVVGHRQREAIDGVQFFGVLPREEIAKLYRRAFAFVLPTLREAFGLSFLEAMAFGLPCIGTRLYAIPEIISDGETGLLVEPADPVQLALAMKTLIDDRARAAKMGLSGRARLDAQFGWDRCAERIRAVLRADGFAIDAPRAVA